MSTVSVLNPTISLATLYPNSHNIDTFNVIAAASVIATKDIAGVASSLVLGSSSNIVLESVGDADMYLRDASGFKIFQTNYVGSTRTDTPLLELRSNVLPGTGVTATVINTGLAGDNALWVYGSDADKTTWVSTAQIREMNAYSQFSTSEANGFLINNSTLFSSNAIFAQDVRMQSTLEVDGDLTLFGNLFSQNLNVWRDNVSSNQRVGFGFQINSNNQLELHKYAHYGTSGTKVSKKVAVFGNSPMSETETSDTSFLVFDSMVGGIGVSKSSASNANSPLTPSSVNSWVFTSLGNVSTTSAVGIGKAEPLHSLDVTGTVNSDVISATNLVGVSVTTTSDERLKEIRGIKSPAQCLEGIVSLDVIDYAYLTDPENFKTGVRAQQVEKSMPDAVVSKTFAGLDDCKLIENSVMIGYLVGAIKQLAARLG